MKKIFLLLMLLVSICINAQSFEGYIVYENKVVSKNPKVSDGQYLRLVGNSKKVFIVQKGII